MAFRLPRSCSPERESQPQTPYRKRIELEKNDTVASICCVTGGGTFLPGYGFPTDVVTFDNFTMEDYIREKSQKSRDKKIAKIMCHVIRDFPRVTRGCHP